MSQALNALPSSTKLDSVRQFLVDVVEEQSVQRRRSQVLRSLFWSELLQVGCNTAFHKLFQCMHISFEFTTVNQENLGSDKFTYSWCPLFHRHSNSSLQFETILVRTYTSLQTVHLLSIVDSKNVFWSCKHSAGNITACDIAAATAIMFLCYTVSQPLLWIELQWNTFQHHWIFTPA